MSEVQELVEQETREKQLQPEPGMNNPPKIAEDNNQEEHRNIVLNYGESNNENDSIESVAFESMQSDSDTVPKQILNCDTDTSTDASHCKEDTQIVVEKQIVKEQHCLSSVSTVSEKNGSIQHTEIIAAMSYLNIPGNTGGSLTRNGQVENPVGSHLYSDMTIRMDSLSMIQNNNAPMDEQHNQDGEQNDRVGAAENVVEEVGQVEEPQNVDNTAQPEVREDIDGKHVVNERIIRRFVNLTEFEKFARSSSGLALSEDLISSNCQGTSTEKMEHLLSMWGNIQELKPSDYCDTLVQRVTNYFERPHRWVHGEIPRRIEDTFQDIIIPGLTNDRLFHQFARSARGLRLYGPNIDHLKKNHSKDDFKYKMEVLKYWRMCNWEEATSQKIIDLKKSFLESCRR